MKTKLQTAIAIHQSGDLEQAESLYLSLLETQPDNTDILHLLGILNAQKKNFETALSYIHQALQLDPNVPSFYNSLGNIYKNQKQWQKAIDAYYQSIQLNPSNSQALNNLGNLLYEQGKWGEAIQHYQSSLKIKPNSADTYCNLGLAFKMQGALKEAQAAFQKSIEFDPLQASARMELGRFAQLEENYSMAAEHYQYCLKAEPDHLEARSNLGAVFLAQGKLPEAIETFKKALSLDAKHIESLTNLANAHLQNQSLNDAMYCYLRLLEIQPDFDVYYNLGVIYMHKEHHQSAIEYFHQALKLTSDDLNTHINLGGIYLKMENPLKAIEHYETALKLSPNHPEIHYLLAALKQKNVDFQSAPVAYVQSLFDQYAPYFDTHLKEYLHYQSPQALFKAVTQYSGVQTATWNVLDLGCGTGLCGVLFRPLAKHLVGIDLSPKMIEMARLKGCYDLLKTESIETALPGYHDQDLILAADVLTYIGALENLFKWIAKALKPKGLFAFTTEKTSAADYVLQPSARFAHHPKYIETLSREMGFDIVICENTVLREQKKQPLEGYLWIIQKTTHAL